MGVEGRQGSGRARSASLLACVRAGMPRRRQLHKLQTHLAHSRTDQANLSGYPIGYINFAPFLVGTAVIDAHKFEPAVADIDNAYPGAEGQIRMRRGQTLGVISLAVGGLSTIEAGAVPAGVAYPHFERFDGIAQVRYQGGLHRRANQEHQRQPSDGSPGHEERSSHSVVNQLQTTRKCSKKDALCQLFSTGSLSLISLKELMLALFRVAGNWPKISSLARGSVKLAVPTCTADAPTTMYSSTSSAVSIPPSPRIGIFTTLRTSQTSLNVMGLIAGPDSPPVTFPKRDLPVLKSTAIAG